MAGSCASSCANNTQNSTRSGSVPQSNWPTTLDLESISDDRALTRQLERGCQINPLCGSAYPRVIDFARFRKIADSSGEALAAIVDFDEGAACNDCSYPCFHERPASAFGKGRSLWRATF